MRRKHGDRRRCAPRASPPRPSPVVTTAPGGGWHHRVDGHQARGVALGYARPHGWGRSTPWPWMMALVEPHRPPTSGSPTWTVMTREIYTTPGISSGLGNATGG